MNKIKLFQDKKIRTLYNTEEEKWYFSIIDVIEILSESNNPRRYWSDLKRKLTKEGFDQLYEIIVQLKLESAGGKRYKTDCTDTKGLLRIIQSIPSPKAEPFKRWLASNILPILPKLNRPLYKLINSGIGNSYRFLKPDTSFANVNPLQ